MEDLIEKQIEKLCEFLKARGVKRIICIDDDWENLKDRNTESKTIDYDKIFNDFKASISQEKQNILKNASATSWSLLNDSIEINEVDVDEMKVLLEIKEQVEKKGKRSKKYKLDVSLTLLKEIVETLKNKGPFELNFVAEPLTGKDIEGRKVSYDNSMVFVDRLYNEKERGVQGRPEDDKLVETLTKIMESETKGTTSSYCIVYSNEGLDQIGDHNARLKFIKEKDIKDNNKQLYLLYKIDGLRKTHKKDELVEGLNQIVNRVGFSNSVYKYLKETENCFEKTVDELVKFDKANFDKDATDAFIEGGQVVDYVSSAIESIFYKNFRRSLNSHGKLYDIVREMSSYDKYIGEKLDSEFDPLSKNGYQKKLEQHRIEKLDNSTRNDVEHNVGDYSINSRYLDVSIGDLFWFKDNSGNEKFGVMVSQQCDCVIRNPVLNEYISNPCRKKNDFRLLILDGAKIENVDKNDVKGMVKKVYPILFKKNYYHLNPIDTREIFQIRADVLDLCSLSKEGMAVLDEREFENAMKYKNYHSEKYFKDRYSSWDNLKKEILILQKSVIEKTTIENTDNRRDVEDAFLESNLRVKVLENGFNIKRICRLEKNTVLHMIQTYHDSEAAIGTEAIRVTRAE